MKRSIFALLAAMAAGVTLLFPFASLAAGVHPDSLSRLIDTRLDVRFDYARHLLHGKATITAQPRKEATDSLLLDARSMTFRQITLIKQGRSIPLHYSYDGNLLHIGLDKRYTPSQSYTVSIDYTADPDAITAPGGRGKVSDTHGLYFINTRGEEGDKPVQIWTQGEPVGSSAWFPTIDYPDQKTRQQISITVPAQYVTLSNGALIAQHPAGPGLRTDTWRMENPHSPYLFMMAVGDFSIYQDKWRDKAVNYYLEPAFAPYAKTIFGRTPQMIGFYSSILGVDYPWNKYSQVVVRDYNGDGAMENTSATLIGENLQQTPREWMDQDYDKTESTIAHELFHQWFGDYVTCRTWGDLTVNESFACLSESLWAEHADGLDEGAAHMYKTMQQYLSSKSADKETLTRKNYDDPQELFDEVTYQKGACVLNMLRTWLGEKDFYKGLHAYLSANAFGNSDARGLCVAFERATGKDVQWFFDQWYDRPGHPALDITYHWDDATHTQSVFLRQTQAAAAFILPMSVDVYVNGGKERHAIVMRTKTDTITFTLPARPQLTNVDADKTLLLTKEDHKTAEEFIFQYEHPGNLIDRLEALEALAGQKDAFGQKLVQSALNDNYYGLRMLAIQSLDMKDPAVRAATTPVLRNLSLKDDHSQVRTSALEKLADLKDSSNIPLFTAVLENDSSYRAETAALNGLAAIAPDSAFRWAGRFEKDNKGSLTVAICYLYARMGSEQQVPFLAEAFRHSGTSIIFEVAKAYTILLAKVNNTNAVKDGVEKVKGLALHYNKFGVGKYAIKWLNKLKQQKNDLGVQADADLKEELTTQVALIDESINQIKSDKNYRNE